MPARSRVCMIHPPKKGNPMGDLSFLSITAAFFAVSILYAYFCEKVR